MAYVLRPTVAQERLSVTPGGQVLLRLRQPWRDGTTHLVFDPVEFLGRLAVLIPRPRINLILYHGVLAPRAAWRRIPAPDAATSRPACLRNSRRERFVSMAPHLTSATCILTSVAGPRPRPSGMALPGGLTVGQPSDELDCQQLFSGEACRGLGLFREHDRARYCVLHLPADDKVPEFDQAVRSKLDAGDFNFHSVYFPAGTDVRFSGIAFTRAIFDGSVFCGHADFGGASFEHTASFCATFKAGASFDHATFASIADFRYATVHQQLAFTYASFNSYLYLEGAPCPTKLDTFANPVFEDKATLSLYGSRIEKPERLSFRRLRLEPHWFVDTDARAFEFVNVRWDDKGIDDAVAHLKYARPYPLLSIAYRQLATNAEENHRFDEASRFRYGSMDALRLEPTQGWAVWRLSWWYWLLSGYSERPGRASAVLLLMLALFAAAYTQATFLQAEGAPARPATVRLDPGQAAIHSLECALLQRPEPTPATPAGRLVVALETVLGPLQGALLTLAIRRKFLR